jgi:hypothetical protein
MKKTHKIRYILLGALLTVLISQLCVPALAALAKKTIDVYTGVNIYVDDVKLDPKDANGNPVEVFVYNGTTYLPVRAVGEAYGKVVQWDGSTQSVYLGEHSSDTPAIMLKDLDYFTGKTWDGLYTSDKDNLGNTYNQSCSTNTKVDNVYQINGQYSKITGTFYLRYPSRSVTANSSFLKIYGDGKLLFNGTVTGGVEPIFFDVDLTGVLELEVCLDGKDSYWDSQRNRFTGAIGDCGLYT